MPTLLMYYNDRKYDIHLSEKGDAIAYFVEVYPKGKRTTMRLVWSAARHGYKHGDIPQRLKDILNTRGAADAIARAMGW